MKKLTETAQNFYKAIKEDFTFYCLMISICVPLYVLLDWLDNWQPAG